MLSLIQSDLMPHGFCIKWSSDLLNLYVVSDALIFLAYTYIGISLILFAKSHKELEWNTLLWLFAAFILACGVTHLMDIVTFWLPFYWVDATLKSITALVSVGTVLYLAPRLSKLLNMHSHEEFEAVHEEKRRSDDQLLFEKHERWEIEILKQKYFEHHYALDKAAIFVETNAQGVITFVNEHFCRISGYSKEELIGATHGLLKSDIHTSEFYGNLWTTIKNGQVWNEEVCNRHKNGSLYWVDTVIVPIIDEGEDKPKKYISIRFDITDRKIAEKLVEEKSRELYLLNLDLEKQVIQRTHELHAALAKAELAVKVKAEFLANMSHEIRTPMNAIIGLSLLGMNAPIDKQHNYLRNIAGASESLLAILNDILDFSKLESGNVQLELDYFNLGEVIENIAMLFTEEVRRKALTFTIIEPSHLNVLLKGDALRLKQILINLINNSAKFTQKGFVKLEISVISQHEKEIQLQFAVKDSGIGMTEEQQKMLFHSFSQADASISRRFGGSGLGLVISQKFVELMGGKITCKSTPEVGSEFFFTLSFETATLGKISETRIAHPVKKTLAQRLAEAAESLENVRVLLVEDTPLNQQVASEFLRNAKLEVTVADNGQEALALLEHNTFDVILMDVQMPVMDGFEATKIIRENAQFAELPIIAMSAGVTLDEQEKCQHVGMSDFIAKPINPVQMLEKIKQHFIKQI